MAGCDAANPLILVRAAHTSAHCAALFRVFDTDNDGFITESDLKNILLMMTGKSLSQSGVDAIVLRTIQQTDQDRDGKISRDDFEARLVENDAMTPAGGLH